MEYDERIATTDSLVSVLRGVHIAAGVAALATFAVPLVTKKGSPLHRRVGRAYVYAMYGVVFAAFAVVAVRLATVEASRRAQPLFLGFVALLSFAACFHGVRVLGQKGRTAPVTSPIDLAVPVVLAAASLGMAAFGLATGFSLGWMFAPLGLAVAVPQLRTLRTVPEGKRWWLRAHLRGMIVAVIGTLTAFLVVNAGRLLPSMGVLPWFLPTIVGVPAMLVWRRKYEG